MSQPTAILFDLDGTLADSEYAHMQAWNQVLAQKNLHLTPTDFIPYIGMADAVMIAKVAAQQGFAADAATLLQQKRQQFKAIAGQFVTALPGVIHGLQKLQQVPKAIVTMSNSADAENIIAAANLTPFFTTIVTSSQVKNVKPHPECYILGATKLGLQPQNCFAVEDSVAGLKAATAAGCVTCAVANSLPQAALAQANYVFKNTADCLQFLQTQF
jgi:HAD superfamily hydrolase (TIGR01509 family)